MKFRGSFLLILALEISACGGSPSQPSPTPSEISTQSNAQPPASPTSMAVIPQTGAQTGTSIPTLPVTLSPTSIEPLSTALPAPTLQSAATPTPRGAPAFDITKRPEGPPLDSQSAFEQWMAAHSPEDPSYFSAKWARAQSILSRQDATDPRIIQAFLRAPRELFFKTTSPAMAYDSAVNSIGYGQTIPGPHLIAHMVQAIDPGPTQKVLEIGTGSAYTSSILSELSNYVYTIEIVPELAQQADTRYTNLSQSYPEYANIHRKNADGYYGWPEYAPFDRIIVTAGIDHVPPDLLAQLTPGGMMVIPVGPPTGQTVLKITKQVQPDGSITFVREDIYHGRKIQFVPFTGGHKGQ